MATGVLMGSQLGGMKRLPLASGALSPEVQRAAGRKKARNFGIAATYIGTTTGDNAAGTLALPGGSAIGDLALVSWFYPGNLNPSMPAGWTRDDNDWTLGPTGNTYRSAVWWRVLDSLVAPVVSGGDVNDNWSASVYRGPKSASLIEKKFAPTAGANNLAFAAFSPDSGNMGFFTAVADRDPSGTPVGPAGFVTRATHISGGGGYSCIAVADMADAANYFGTQPTWTALTASQDQAAFLYALRGY